jgi:hypothetical protein
MGTCVEGANVVVGAVAVRDRVVGAVGVVGVVAIAVEGVSLELLDPVNPVAAWAAKKPVSAQPPPSAARLHTDNRRSARSLLDCGSSSITPTLVSSLRRASGLLDNQILPVGRQSHGKDDD